MCTSMNLEGFVVVPPGTPIEENGPESSAWGSHMFEHLQEGVASHRRSKSDLQLMLENTAQPPCWSLWRVFQALPFSLKRMSAFTTSNMKTVDGLDHINKNMTVARVEGGGKEHHRFNSFSMPGLLCFLRATMMGQGTDSSPSLVIWAPAEVLGAVPVTQSLQSPRRVPSVRRPRSTRSPGGLGRVRLRPEEDNEGNEVREYDMGGGNESEGLVTLGGNQNETDSASQYTYDLVGAAPFIVHRLQSKPPMIVLLFMVVTFISRLGSKKSLDHSTVGGDDMCATEYKGVSFYLDDSFVALVTSLTRSFDDAATVWVLQLRCMPDARNKTFGINGLKHGDRMEVKRTQLEAMCEVSWRHPLCGKRVAVRIQLDNQPTSTPFFGWILAASPMASITNSGKLHVSQFYTLTWFLPYCSTSVGQV
jgi:hypothetical protein